MEDSRRHVWSRAQSTPPCTPGHALGGRLHRASGKCNTSYNSSRPDEDWGAPGSHTTDVHRPWANGMATGSTSMDLGQLLVEAVLGSKWLRVPASSSWERLAMILLIYRSVIYHSIFLSRYRVLSSVRGHSL